MNNSNLNSVKNTLFSSKPSKAIRLLVVAFFVLAQTVTFGQTVGDYRSIANGNWTNLASWQYYNGTTWVTPSGSSPQGYPGQFAGTGTVTIRNTNTITLTTSITNLFTKLIIGNATSSGVFAVGADIANFNTLDIVLNPTGNMNFTGQNELKLPANSGIKINAPGQITTTGNGTCTNNTAIYIGGIKFGVCKGAGNAEYTFVELNTFGGTLFSAPSSNTPVCLGNSINLTGGYSGPTPTSITYLWSIKAPDNTVTTFSTQNLSLTALQIGNYQATLTCDALYDERAYSNSETITVTINVLPIAPTPAPPTQPTCSDPTGSVVLSDLPTGTWTITRNPGAVKTEGTGSSTTISGLASGTYTFTVSNGTCTSIASNDVVINASTNTWNVVSGVGSWTNTLTNSQAITFNGDYNSTGDLTACSCNVNTGKKVTIKSGHNLIITNGVTVSETGTLIFEDSASLVQIDSSAVNSGNITYKRYTSIRSTDYTYWSSPVASYTLGGVSQNKTLSDKYYSFNSTIDNWQQESASTVMNPGVGYIVRGPELKSTSNLPPPPVGLFEASFIGVPNNGDKSITSIIENKSYLLGNPYPSAIDANDFLIANKDVLNGTLYFWTNHTEIGTNVSNPGTGVLAYSSDDYATYNATGGVAAAPDLDPTTGKPYPEASPSGSAKPNGTIAAGQGFFASSKTTLSGTSIVFNNDMRVIGTISTEGTGANQQFFKTKNTKSKATTLIEKNRIWLNLKNNQGAFKQTLIGYITNATNEYDSSFDGESFDGNEFIDFYSVNNDMNLVIQGRALPFDENDTVPLGFRSTIEGDFTINIDETDGLLTNQPVFLEDKLTNKVFDLKSGIYTFNTVAGTFDDRFVLRYTNKTLSVDETDKEDGILVLYSNNYKTLIIHNNDMYSTVNSVALFNITGQNIANWEVNDSEQTNIQFPIKNTSSGIYIVKVKTTKGESSKKIIIR